MAEAVGSIICLIIFMMGYGLVAFFARDFLWELTHWSNQVEGKASERTETWDAWQMIGGGISLLFGIGLACFAISSVTQENTQNANRTATAVQEFVDYQALAVQLDEEFSSVIGELIETATDETQRIRAVDRGISVGRATTLDYGFCPGESFYLYVGNYRRQGESYAYLVDYEPSNCQAEGWNASGATRMAASRLGGSWYTFDYAYVPDMLPADQAATFIAIPSSTPPPTATRRPRPTDGR